MWKLVVIMAMSVSSQIWASGLQDLGKDFFSWRAVQQPCAGDDIPRVERPIGWAPDWSASSLESMRSDYQKYRDRLDALNKEGWTRADYVDFLSLRSAIERVNWELNILRAPHRNPDFYVHQTLGALYEILTKPSLDESDINELLVRLKSIPNTVAHARENLTDTVGPFADIALGNIKDMEQKFADMSDALIKQAPNGQHTALRDACKKAGAAMVAYEKWLKDHRSSMKPLWTIGREGYAYFLKNIAMIPYSPEELLAMGRMEWERSVSFEMLELNRNAGVAKPKIFPTLEAEVKQAAKDEQAIRDFLEKNNIMTVPAWLQHYKMGPRPDHLKPIVYMGVDDDLTNESRLDEHAMRYLPEPGPNLGFFFRATAQDTRPLIIHEGIPGHYYQMARSWKNERPIRRRYIDSGANEGIGFYVEEMMLQAGLFKDSPRGREIIYRFMRLRGLRVEVDIRLAIGDFNVDQAGDYLARVVPMDKETAVHEAGFFAYNPGQAITYQIGKIQIHQFMSDASLQKKDAFNLRDFHDYLMVNGNVPIALLRWERLGLRDQIDKLTQGVVDIPKGL